MFSLIWNFPIECREMVVVGLDPIRKPAHPRYYATTMPTPPKWVAGAKQTLKLGHHIFFKDVP
jgi:spore germination cell wall hydrolase CwlJ-like protein